MPVYTYRCDNCGIQFDQTQKFSDQALTKCPECGKKSLHKVYTPVGIVFKGSGFYATDHRSPSGKPRKITPDHTEPSTEKTADAKVEAVKPQETSSTSTSDKS